MTELHDWAPDQRDQLIAAIRTHVVLSKWAAAQIADAVIASGVRPPADDDEDPQEVRAAFDRGPHGVTAPSTPWPRESR